MSKSLKTTVAEDVTITEEVPEVLEEKEVLAVAVLEEKEVQHQEAEVSEAREVQRREKMDLAEEVNPEDHRHQDAKEDSHQKEHQELAIFQAELQDVQKVLLTDQEKEDQEKAKTFC